jgi:hypothetical protein
MPQLPQSKNTMGDENFVGVLLPSIPQFVLYYSELLHSPYFSQKQYNERR